MVALVNFDREGASQLHKYSLQFSKASNPLSRIHLSTPADFHMYSPHISHPLPDPCNLPTSTLSQCGHPSRRTKYAAMYHMRTCVHQHGSWNTHLRSQPCVGIYIDVSVGVSKNSTMTSFTASVLRLLPKNSLSNGTIFHPTSSVIGFSCGKAVLTHF